MKKLTYGMLVLLLGIGFSGCASNNHENLYSSVYYPNIIKNNKEKSVYQMNKPSDKIVIIFTPGSGHNFKPTPCTPEKLNSKYGIPNVLYDLTTKKINIPGTTRDYLEGDLIINDIPITLVDTAGIRESEDIIEKIGVQKVYSKIKEDDLIIFLYDENGFTDDIKKLYDEFGDKNHILVQNKNDKGVYEFMQPDLKISVKESFNVDKLKSLIFQKLSSGVLNSEMLLITNERHKKHIDSAYENLNNAFISINEQLPLEFVAQDLKRAFDEVGAILGDVTPDDILGNIFQNFCIGK